MALTESAVSRQVASLEGTLGINLFNRIKKRVTLTQAGRVYSEQVRDSLERIERDTREIMAHEGKGGIIELAVLPAFACQWPIPRLGVFNGQQPEITINMSARTGIFLFNGTPFDGAIHFGEPTWPGTHATYLFNEETVPVCKPALLEKGRDMTVRALSAGPLLHSASRPEDWSNWFAAAGIEDINAMKGPRFELHSMLISAACAGLGLALLPRFLVATHLASGALIIPLDHPAKSAKAYYLVNPEGRKSSQPFSLFSAWLQKEAEQFRHDASIQSDTQNKL